MSKKYVDYNKRQAIAKRFAAIIAGTLAFLMIASVILSALPVRAAVTQSSVNALKNQLSGITSKKNNAKSELNSIRSKKASVLDEINKLDAAIEAAEEELEVQENLISELDELIGIKEIELADSEAKEAEQYEKLRSRVRFMYENGSMSYLSILLSSDDFSDFLSRYEVISQISN